MLPIFHAAIHREQAAADAARARTSNGAANGGAAQWQPTAVPSQHDVWARYAVMLTYRRAWRQANRQVEEYRGHSRWGQKDRKKNCAVRRRVLTVDRKRKEELHASIVALQDTIVTMERTQLLADSAHVNARSDRSTLVIKAVQLYYEMFAYGYDSDTVGSERIRQYARSAIDPDVICPDHKGLENLLSQWELYTRCHGHFIVRLAEVKLVDDGDDLVSVRQRGEFRLGITETTLQKLFPAFYAYVQKQPNGADILATLVGKEYVIEFVQVMHYNSQCRLLAHESRTQLASGLLGAVQDPFTAMRLMDAALLTSHGHWQLPDQDQVHDACYALPKSLL